MPSPPLPRTPFVLTVVAGILAAVVMVYVFSNETPEVVNGERPFIDVGWRTAVGEVTKTEAGIGIVQFNRINSKGVSEAFVACDKPLVQEGKIFVFQRRIKEKKYFSTTPQQSYIFFAKCP